MSTFTVTVFTASHSHRPSQATKSRLMKRGIPFVELPLDGNVIKDAAEARGLTQAPLVRVMRDGEETWWAGHDAARIDGLAAS